VNVRKLLKWGVSIIILSIIVVLYRKYSPENSKFFPKCPFWLLTGWQCPGCGSQRAIHCLLNFDILQAMKQNVLVVLLFPYLVLYTMIDLIKQPSERVLRWRSILFGSVAIYVVFALIVLFWIIRNLI